MGSSDFSKRKNGNLASHSFLLIITYQVLKEITEMLVSEGKEQCSPMISHGLLVVKEKQKQNGRYCMDEPWAIELNFIRIV